MSERSIPEAVINGLEWLSERIPYPEPSVTGDTFPMTWADDGEIYTSAGDPMWGECTHDHGMDVEKIVGCPPHYQIMRPHLLPDMMGYGGDGPKPTGMICVGGVLYLAFQNMLGRKPPAHGTKCQHGSDAHIICSHDKGKTWEPSFKDIKTPMFPGHLFGGPAFVNYGKNNEGARDEYVYAVSGDQFDNGSELRLGRVPKDRILDADAWEWVSDFGHDGVPNWAGNLAESVPVLMKERSISLPEMVYLRKIERYLLLTWRLREDFSPADGTDLFIYESPEPWGPFSLVHFEEMWEGKLVNPYCPRLALKWMEPDGVTGWLQFSGSWNSPHDRQGYRPYYRSNVRKFRLTVAAG
jgi:hypothetical protein